MWKWPRLWLWVGDGAGLTHRPSQQGRSEECWETALQAKRSAQPRAEGWWRPCEVSEAGLKQARETAAGNPVSWPSGHSKRCGFDSESKEELRGWVVVVEGVEGAVWWRGGLRGAVQSPEGCCNLNLKGSLRLLWGC